MGVPAVGSTGVAFGNGARHDTARRDTWQLRAACRGPESGLFFPPPYPERRDEREARELRAKAICTQCAVRAECLAYALGIREPHGIWGGLNEAERRALLARQTG